MSSDSGRTITINFKAYPQVEGEGAISLAQICELVALETGAPIAVAPPMVSLAAVAEAVDIPVYAQSIDPKRPGSATGWVTAEMVQATSAVGTLINHSEHQFPDECVEECVRLAKACDLVTCVCANDVDAAKRFAAYKPDYIAVEPPELIGGDISVTTADPGIVSGTVDAVHSVDKDVRVLCGAGVKNGKDVKAAFDLGADGVLLASGVVKAKDPEAVLRDLVSGL